MKNYFQRRVSLVLSAYLLFFASMLLHSVDVLSKEDRLLFADGLYKRQLYKQAAREYATYLEDYPDDNNNDALLCNLGEALRLSGNKHEACKVFYTLVKHKNSKYNNEALLKLASMLLDINKVDESEKISNSLINKNPPKEILAEALYLHGSALVRMGNTAEAIKRFDRLINECSISHYVPYAKVALGSILADPSYNQLPKAEQLLNAAISSKLPTQTLEAECYFYLGYVHFSMKKYRDAATDFSNLISKFPEDTRLNDVYIKLVWSYFLSGMYTEASTAALGALQSRGGFSNSQLGELRYVAANSFFEVSNYEKAIELYKSVLDVDASSQFGHKASLNLAKAYFNKGLYTETIDILRPICNIPKYREDAIWLTAEASSVAKNYDVAVQNYRIIANEFSNGEYADDALFRVANVYRDAKQREEAAATFLQLSEKYPKSEFAADSLFFAAHSYAIDNDERALGLWKRFVKEFSGNPKVPVATYHIAVEENRKGNNEEALNAFVLLYTAYPKSEYVGEAYLWSGNLFAAKGELAQAEKNLRKALTYKLTVESTQTTKFMLATVLQKLNREDESIQIMKDLLDNNISESFTPQNLAWLSKNLMDRKLWAEAEKAAIKLASGIDVSSAWKQTGWALAARAAVGAGKDSDAETYYRNALNCDAKTRDYIECCYYLGELLMKNKNFVQAEAFFAEAAKLSVDMPEFSELRIYSYIGHGRCAIAQGKRNEGIRILSAASLLFTDEKILPPVMAETVSLLKEEGREDEAEKIIKDLINIYPNSAEAKRFASEAK